MKYFWLILIYLLFLGSVSQLSAEENDLIEVIQKQYQSIRSFSGRFIQSSHLADTETDLVTPLSEAGVVTAVVTILVSVVNASLTSLQDPNDTVRVTL